jgi:hypothetical protein
MWEKMKVSSILILIQTKILIVDNDINKRTFNTMSDLSERSALSI